MQTTTALKFYLGTHQPSWLSHAGVPLFVSRVRLEGRRTLPRAIESWALDSGGFSEIATHGRWTVSAADYAAEVKRYAEEIGSLDWAAPQDWMCEPDMVRKTGLSVDEHQRRTVASVLELRALGCRVIPVIQGWSVASYLRCVELYEDAGIDLASEPTVGVGSVCRRQNTTTGGAVIALLADGCGLRNLHGFGFKRTGLRARNLASADSLAWSTHARHEPVRDACKGLHAKCTNCLAFALEWRSEMLEAA